MGGQPSVIERWLSFLSEAFQSILQVAMSRGRKWRRRRTLLGKTSAEQEKELQNELPGASGSPESPDDDDQREADEDPWAASEPHVHDDVVAESELDGTIDTQLGEQVKPTQEILESDPSAVKMADATLTEQFDKIEKEALPDEEWLSADSDESQTNRSDESEELTLSDGLYEKLMRPSDDDDDEEMLVAATPDDDSDPDVASESLEESEVQEYDAGEEFVSATAEEEEIENNDDLVKASLEGKHETDEDEDEEHAASAEDNSSNDSSVQLVFRAGELNEHEEEYEEGVEEQEDGILQQEPVVIREAAMRPKGFAGADAEDKDAAAEGMFVTDDDQVIDGESSPTANHVYPAMPAGLLDSADSFEDEAADLVEPNSSLEGVSEEDLPKHVEPDYLTTGAAMKNNTESKDSKNELATSSRMERLKPKQANSLTGAPAPKVDMQVEDSVLAPESEVLLVAAHAPERNTFRTYLRRHDIPCRAAISAENAVSVVLGMKPAAVLISGSCMNPEEIITLVDDLNDMVDAPILALLTEPQIKLLSNDPLSAHVLQYPASLRHIRAELTRILIEEGNAKPRCSLRSALLPK